MTDNGLFQDKFIQLNGLRFHYLEWGRADAPPLILLHGFADHAHRWDTFSRAMQDAWRVLALDMRGHGESDWADDYSRDKMVEDVAAWVETLGLERVAVVGHSMGARIGYLYAAQNPARVTRLVIVDNAPEINPRGIRRMRDSVLSQEDFASPDELFRAARAANARPSDEDMWNRVRYGLKQRDDGRWVWRYDKELRSPTRPRVNRDPAQEWAVLPQIQCPTLLVYGDDSDMVSAEIMERMQRAISNSRVVVVKDSGHSVQTDNPAGFVMAVKPFLLAGS